jgi:hypothetical protein
VVSPRAEPQPRAQYTTTTTLEGINEHGRTKGGALLSVACLAAAAAADMARRKKRIQSSMRVTVHDVWGRRYQLGFSMDL